MCVKVDRLMAIYEDLTYDQLFRMSEPKRVKRSDTVITPPLDIDASQDDLYYFFNFKGNPSTTKMRQKGYVRFKKPRRSRDGTPLSKMKVEVDCTCPDYKYRWAWTNKQRGAGKVGAGSLNQAWNVAPRKTNPASRPGLCKHILATKKFIYGLVAAFPEGGISDGKKLDKLTRASDRRWKNYDVEFAKAKERDARMQLAKARRRIGVPGIGPGSYEDTVTPDALPDDQTDQTDQTDPTDVGQDVDISTDTGIPDEVEPKYGGYGSKAEYDYYRRQGLGDSFGYNFKRPSVVTAGVNMKTIYDEQTIGKLNGALLLLKEMADDLESIEEPQMDDGEFSETPPPQVPISDEAVGADSEGTVALSTLKSIDSGIQQLVDLESGEDEEDPEDEEDYDEEMDGLEDSGTYPEMTSPAANKNNMPLASGA